MANASGKVTNAQFSNLEILVRKSNSAEQSEMISKSILSPSQIHVKIFGLLNKPSFHFLQKR